MANGPMGGFMPTPPAPAQPPQVKLDTTASSRGTFNNFLKSMNGATSLNPPSMAPSMGVASPMLAPAANIDIFNQPVQNFQFGGFADDTVGDTSGTFSVDDQGNVSDSFDFFSGSDDPPPSTDLSSATIQAGTSLVPENVFADDPAVVDRRGVNVGLENRGKFSAGVVPNLLGERFARFENVPLAMRGIARDFRSKINKANDNNQDLTVGSYFNTFNPSDDNAPRLKEFEELTGKKAGDKLNIGDMRNIMNVQAKYEAGIRNVAPAVQNTILSTVDIDDDRRVEDILGSLDLGPLDTKARNQIPDVLPTLTQEFFRSGRPGGDIRSGLTYTGPGGSFTFSETMDQIKPGGRDEFAVRSPDVYSEGIFDIDAGVPGADMRGGRRDPFDSGLRGSLTPGASQDLIDTAKNAIRSNANNNLAIDNIVAQFGSLDPSIVELADRTKRGIGEIGQIKPGDVEDFSGTPTTLPPTTTRRDVQGPIQARTIFDLDTTGTREFRIPDSQSELDQAPSATRRLGFASSKIPGQFDETASGEAFAGGDIPLSVAPFTTTRRTTADDTDPREDTLGVLPAQTIADIERLSNVPVGQRKAGPGSDPTFFSGLGLPSIFDGIERFSRDRMASKLARGDVPERNIIRNDSGLVIGIKDNFGNLIEGRDPNAPLGGDDNQEPIIRRPIAPIVEDKPKDDDKPPNIIGGITPGDPVVTLPVEPTTVVPSPFAPASSAIRPVTFDSGELNKLIELLTGVPAKPVVAAQEGGLIRAVDDFLSTGT